MPSCDGQFSYFQKLQEILSHCLFWGSLFSQKVGQEARTPNFGVLLLSTLSHVSGPSQESPMTGRAWLSCPSLAVFFIKSAKAPKMQIKAEVFRKVRDEKGRCSKLCFEIYFFSACNPREMVRVRTEQVVPRKWETDTRTEETGLCTKGGSQVQHDCLVTLV